jgi:hypothetical protein
MDVTSVHFLREVDPEDLPELAAKGEDIDEWFGDRSTICPVLKMIAGSPSSVSLKVSFACGAGRKRIETDMITGPAWTLEGRTFPAAGGAACASTQFIA